MPEPKENTTKTRYSSIIPDSQFYTDLRQLQTYLKFKSDDNYLKTAVQNTINMGYNLKKVKNKKKKMDRFGKGVKKYGFDSNFVKEYQSLCAQLRHDELDDFFKLYYL